MTPISGLLPFFNNESTTTMFTFFAIFAVLLFVWFYAKPNKSSPPLPPGPRPLPVIGNLASLDPNLHLYFAHLARTYGPILKLQLGFKLGIVISSPALAREVLKDQDITFANRDVPDVVRACTYGGKDIAWTPYGPEWRMLRKVCVLNLLNNTTLNSVYGLRRHEVRQTVSCLYSRAGSAVNVGEQMFTTILNVITNMLWGATVQGEERASLGVEFRPVISEITELVGKPNLSDLFPVLGWLDPQGLHRKMARLAQKFDTIFDRIIEKRLKMDGQGGNKADGRDFLQFLLKAKDEGDEKTPLTMLHVKALLMDMIVGGSDTSSSSIEFAMAEILNKPEVLRKAHEELDNVVGKDNIVEESHIHKLPYLYAIMKESLRLHPALPLLVPRCPSETCIVGGYTVPKGSRVFLNAWAIHRDPSIWENPLEFKPERFLENKLDFGGSEFNYFPFGSGRRICAGTAMAERMLLYSLAALLHSFDWKIPEGKKVVIVEKFGIVLKLKNPLMAIPVPRLSDPTLYE